MATENSGLLAHGSNSHAPYERFDKSGDIESVDAVDPQGERRWSLTFKIFVVLGIAALIYAGWRWGFWQWIWGGLKNMRWYHKDKHDKDDSHGTLSATNSTNTTMGYQNDDGNDESSQSKLEFSCAKRDENAHLSTVMDKLFHLPSVFDKIPEDPTKHPKSCPEAERFCHAEANVLATVTSQRCRHTCGACDETDVQIATRFGGPPTACHDDDKLLEFFLKRAKSSHNVDGIQKCSDASDLCREDTHYLSTGVRVICKDTCGTCDESAAISQVGPTDIKTCKTKEKDGCFFGSNTGCCEGETCLPPTFNKNNAGSYTMDDREEVIAYCELSHTLLDLDAFTLFPHCSCLKAN